jgi:hypothetical protein
MAGGDRILAADVKQRPIQSSISVGVWVIALLILIMGAIALAWWHGSNTVIQTNNVALKTTRSFEFQVTPTWGDCPEATGCEAVSAVQTLNGTLTLLPDAVTGIGSVDGTCVNTRVVDVSLDSYMATCMWTIVFTGNGSIPSGTVNVMGQQYYPMEAGEFVPTTMASVGGTGNYVGISGGDLVFLRIEDEPLINMTLSLTFLA